MCRHFRTNGDCRYSPAVHSVKPGAARTTRLRRTAFRRRDAAVLRRRARFHRRVHPEETKKGGPLRAHGQVAWLESKSTIPGNWRKTFGTHGCSKPSTADRRTTGLESPMSVRYGDNFCDVFPALPPNHASSCCRKARRKRELSGVICAAASGIGIGARQDGTSSGHPAVFFRDAEAAAN